MRMKTVMAVLMAVGSQGVLASPQIDESSIRLDLSETGRLEVGYTLKNEDAIVTMEVLTNDVPLAHAQVRKLSGDVCKRVKAGDRTAYWQMRSDLPGVALSSGDLTVRLTAWSVQTPPDYLLVDLGAKNCCFFYVDLDSLPYGHPTNSAVYKSAYMLMRKIPAAGVTFRMGANSNQTGHASDGRDTPRYVKLSDDYYMSVFEMTEGQMKTVRGGSYWSSDTSSCSDLATRDEHPVTRINFNEIRRVQAGATPAATDLGAWPENGHKVGANSVLQAIRDRTGIRGMDLPTAAQWEYACRAGRGELLNVELRDGQTVADVAWFGEHAKVGGAGKRHPVGRKLPNAWGLYDMHGNIEEWVLDVYSKSFDSSIEYEDPIGPSTSGTSANRTVKSGHYNRDESSMVSSMCTDWQSSRAATQNEVLGFRLICPVIFESVGVPLTAADK